MRACPTCGISNGEAAKFCQECGTALAAPQEARRRLVTALFCDLVGSTQMGERLDPEALRKLLDRYYDAMRSAIERHGGTVEKFIGDAVVGTFGVPVAHEDDTLRAVRAAMEMREAAAGIELPVRIAISVGEALADEAAAKQGRIAGDVFNTAARLQAAAEPGDVLVSSSAERMLRGRVEVERLGPVELKGKAEPVQAYRVRQVRPKPTRFGTPMVGRGRALAKPVDALDEAIEIRACVLVSVLSAPGVGKSRLAESFVEAIAADTAWAVRRLLEALAAERPLVAVLEDVHWAEPPMLDRFAAAGVTRAILRLPSEPRDAVLPLLDRYAKLIR